MLFGDDGGTDVVVGALDEMLVGGGVTLPVPASAVGGGAVAVPVPA
jgi:hypothetical protein